MSDEFFDQAAMKKLIKISVKKLDENYPLPWSTWDTKKQDEMVSILDKGSLLSKHKNKIPLPRKETMPKCKDCGLPLSFQSINGKMNPFNPDGSDHWDLCKKTENARIMENSKPFQDEKGSGYMVENEKMYFIMSSGWITGSKYIKKQHSESPPF